MQRANSKQGEGAFSSHRPTGFLYLVQIVSTQSVFILIDNGSEVTSLLLFTILPSSLISLLPFPMDQYKRHHSTALRVYTCRGYHIT
jgi:hypothetical protein